ncbi:hypothetical protein FHX82_004551 [Amycolatopsis bartoniae]|uniref:PEP-CTERM sorting domain-containing protein n=1 Tax=Amycolatopsis bartoniae TaxID=941986 RepID=A0A8H9MH64_9PSEU|nr:spherulation-specific family 4 protein [Amycolatopsis bartoniae]MBB2937478.1 hypothetical protein [Amycolatopsis bartoniae]TVS99763.1 PEP-CTERM sorting domain-containing protein [Amycolatopsis bartoniae]GHF87058.1 hypothetical protein GCM10017566_71180 [Amycolatopsis bartoniae]
MHGRMFSRLLATASALAAAVTVGTATAAPTVQHLAIPAYFNPATAYWPQLTASSAVGIAIANPNSGPGSGFDQQYADAIQAASAAGRRVIGYVDTGYFGTTGRTTHNGETSVEAWTAQAEAEVSQWYSWYGSYGLSGIFFDDGLPDCGHVDLYKAVDKYVKDNYGGFTVDNPGGAAEECYSSAADVIVMFEGTYASYTGWTAPSWELSADPDKIWHLVYSTASQSDMENAMALSRQRNAGYVYVTPDGPDGNPWDSLPTGSYWTGETALIGA